MPYSMFVLQYKRRSHPRRHKAGTRMTNTLYWEQVPGTPFCSLPRAKVRQKLSLLVDVKEKEPRAL